MSQRRVFLHIGLSKSGTTYLQAALWGSRDRLRDRGLLVPGEMFASQRQAVWDLLGRRLPGVEQPDVPGAWGRFVDSVRTWYGDKVVLSEEFLVHAQRRQVRRILRSLQPAEVHVVVTVRDLERTIASMWQQELALSRTWPFSTYLAAVRDPGTSESAAGVRFWLRFDLERILSTWTAVIPPERVHVVVVPPPGSPPQLLLSRFAEAVGIDVDALQVPEAEVNTAVGMAEAEALRRLNLTLKGRLNPQQYDFVMERAIRPALRERAGRPISVPAQDRAWIADRSAELIEHLKSRDYRVLGDLSELMPHPREDGPDQPSQEDAAALEAAVSEAAIAALGATAERYAKLWAKHRVRRASTASPAARLASTARAATFGARFKALEIADRNKTATRVANLYLRLSRRR